MPAVDAATKIQPVFFVFGANIQPLSPKAEMRHLRSKPENLNQTEITSQPVSKRTNSLVQRKKIVFSIQGLSKYYLAVIDDFQNLRSRSSWCGYKRESAGIYIYIQTYTYVYTHTHTYIHICSSHRSLLPTHLHTYTPIQSSPRWYLGCDLFFPPLPFVNVRTWLTQRGCHDFFVLNFYFYIFWFICGRTWLDTRGMPRLFFVFFFVFLFNLW